jgi:6-phosphogluconate dehydrogenase
MASKLIAESYAMMKDLLSMSHTEISQTFKDWNAGELESYLIEITGDIFTTIYLYLFDQQYLIFFLLMVRCFHLV